MELTPKQAIKNFNTLLNNPNLRILNLVEFQILLQSIEVLKHAITKTEKRGTK